MVEDSGCLRLGALPAAGISADRDSCFSLSDLTTIASQQRHIPKIRYHIPTSLFVLRLHKLPLVANWQVAHAP